MLNIQVGNLPLDAIEGELLRAFAAHGAVTAVAIAKDPRTGKSRGFGYVAMPDKGQARRAIRALHRREIRGRAIRVRPRAVETQADFGDCSR